MAWDMSRIIADAQEKQLAQTGLIKGSARETQAYLSRQQWEDYKTRFVPLENELLAAYDNPAQRQEGVNKAVSLANTAYDTSQGIMGRNMARYGINMTPQQQASVQSSSNLSRSLAGVDAANRTKTMFNERNDQLLTGGLTVMPIAGNA